MPYLVSAADLLSNPSTWISRAPAAVFLRKDLRFTCGLRAVVGLFRPAAYRPVSEYRLPGGLFRQIAAHPRH
jgi:hypothetical protein